MLTAGGGVQGFVPQSDLVVFVTSAERPITETEGKLLQYISEWGKKVVMVLRVLRVRTQELKVIQVRKVILALKDILVLKVLLEHKVTQVHKEVRVQ